VSKTLSGDVKPPFLGARDADNRRLQGVFSNSYQRYGALLSAKFLFKKSEGYPKESIPGIQFRRGSGSSSLKRVGSSAQERASTRELGERPSLYPRERIWQENRGQERITNRTRRV